MKSIIPALILITSISACGQKGPLIVEKDDDAIQQETVTNTISDDSARRDSKENKED